jgi:hypothetical protein
MHPPGTAENLGILLIPRLNRSPRKRQEQHKEQVIMRTVRGTALAAIALVGAIAIATPAYAQQKAAYNFSGITFTPPAQQDTDQGVGIGALGGLNIAFPAGSDASLADSGTGWMFGIWFGGNRNGRVGFMGELSYVEKKIVDATDSDTYISNKVLQIPALVRVNIGSKSRNGVSVYGLIGPNFDFRLSSKVVEDGTEVPEAELEETFSSVDIGLMAGAGVEWNRIGFEFRYSWGMKQLATDEAVEAGVILPEKTNQMQFLAKFRFN